MNDLIDYARDNNAEFDEQSVKAMEAVYDEICPAPVTTTPGPVTTTSGLVIDPTTGSGEQDRINKST